MSEHIVGPKVYVSIFLALMVFTGLTVGAAFINLGPMNAVVALTIAVIKAVLVLLFFMHVRYSSKMVMVLIIAGVFWMGIMFVLTMSDYLSRLWGSYPIQ
jgi:cytochrome c oxidase subunit IV